MCSTTTAVENLECYLEDLVTSFEDFVKKSLLVVTIGIGTLIGMLYYVLRPRESSSSSTRGYRDFQERRNSYTQFCGNFGKNGCVYPNKAVASMGIQSSEPDATDAEVDGMGSYNKVQAGIQPSNNNFTRKILSVSSNTCSSRSLLPCVAGPVLSDQPTSYADLPKPCSPKPCCAQPDPHKPCNQSGLPKPCNQPCPPRPCPPSTCTRALPRPDVKPMPVPTSASNESLFLRETALGPCQQNPCNPKPCKPRLCRPGSLNSSNHKITLPSYPPPCPLKRVYSLGFPDPPEQQSAFMLLNLLRERQIANNV